MLDYKDKVRLHHMLDYSKEAFSMVQGKSRKDIDSDRTLNLSLLRLLEMVGEAANKISKPKRSKYTRIPWSSIINLRNRLIHAYDSVDFDIIWEILIKDLPILIAELEKIISAEE